MGLRRTAAEAVNLLLRPLGAEVVAYDGGEKPWDREFAAWISKAEASGRDPNDIGDAEWSDDPLRDVLARHYLPHMTRTSTVLELGPGTGRLTRHLIGLCHDMVLVDYSQMACAWLEHYLKSRGQFRVVHITRPQLDGVDDASIDMAVANGVFEHLDMDDVLYFLSEFRRVLRPGGRCSFNFNNAATNEGMALFKRFRREVGSKCIFKFHHPETICRLAEAALLQVDTLATSSSRFAQIDLVNPFDVSAVT